MPDCTDVNQLMVLWGEFYDGPLPASRRTLLFCDFAGVEAMLASWFQIAIRVDVVRRALRVALFVGSLLALINHGDTLVAGTVDAVVALQIGLTYLVPYGVSTWSSVQTVRSNG